MMETTAQVISRRNVHQTQWASQFGVASELCKRGYEVAFTMGNCSPLADLIAISPVSRTMFLLEVKGLYRKNPWLVSPKPIEKNLFYVFTYVPPNEPSQFFVMTQKNVNKFIDNELVRLRRSNNYPRKGIAWGLVEPYKNAWEILPT